jgi:hypothetical protein
MSTTLTYNNILRLCDTDSNVAPTCQVITIMSLSTYLFNRNVATRPNPNYPLNHPPTFSDQVNMTLALIFHYFMGTFFVQPSKNHHISTKLLARMPTTLKQHFRQNHILNIVWTLFLAHPRKYYQQWLNHNIFFLTFAKKANSTDK